MTSLLGLLGIAVVALPLLGAAVIQPVAKGSTVDLVFRIFTALTTITALSLAGLIVTLHHPIGKDLMVFDSASALFLSVSALVGLGSTLVSPAYLDSAVLFSTKRLFFSEQRARRWYYLGFACFWSALLAIPLAGNLGVAWLLVEATTAASALLVGFSGKRSALEAGWKYLVLTTLGLTVALLGVVMLYSTTRGRSLSVLDWGALSALTSHAHSSALLVAFLLIMAGLAAKVGWAPVHNWLPDAHSEAPPPVSALLSAALLPSVMLVGWRVKSALYRSVGAHDVSAVFIGFGVVSLAVAVPFLWRPMPWKRLLAYSSLEHMGVLAIGIGIGTPLALAGVVVHLIAHALAKSLGFYSATPLFRTQPRAARLPARGVALSSPGLAAVMGISLGTLSGLPPSPLFFSEVFILAAAFLAGDLWLGGLATVLLALGFLGILHALIEGLMGSRRQAKGDGHLGAGFATLATCATTLLMALAGSAFMLPSSAFIHSLFLWAA
ncbi:MAG: hypothetical protein M1115_01530 [Actinobacteria bacterium]|nr:hypothetical protein [Actinomycetota bacterium]